METISHLRENGRITILFNAFDGPPRICRIFGKGISYEFGTPEYDALIPPAHRRPGSRSVIMINVHKVGTSCGYSVPLYTFERHRDTLIQWVDKLEKTERSAIEERVKMSGGKECPGEEHAKIEGGLKWDGVKENLKSIDGLPGLASAFCTSVVPSSVSIDDEEGGKLQVALGKTSSTRGFLGLKYEELVRLMFAFSLGIVLAMYFKV